MVEVHKVVRDEGRAWIHGELSSQEYFERVYARERAAAHDALERRLGALPTPWDDLKVLGRRIVGIFQR